MNSFHLTGRWAWHRLAGLALLALALALALVSLGALAQDEAPPRFRKAEQTDSYLGAKTIMIRLGQAPTVAQIRAIAQIGATLTLRVPPNVDPVQAMRAFCGGSVAKPYLDLVLEQNPSLRLATDSQERKLQVPPCPRYQFRPDAVVAPGDTIDSFLVRNMGIDQDQTIEQCGRLKSGSTCLTTAKRAVARLNGGKSVQQGVLPVGAKMTAPARTEWSIIPLKEGVSPEQAERILKLQSADAPIATQHTPDLDLVKPLSGSDTILNQTSCDGSVPLDRSTWPYDQSALERALDRAFAAAQQRGPLKRSMVRIVDTGVTGLETFFPPESLWPAPRIAINTVNGQGMGHYGFASGSRTNVEPLNGDPDGLHGTEVADLALGGLAFRSHYKAIYQIIGIDFVNVFKPLPNNTVEADPSALANSIVVNPPPAEILNISLGGVDANPSFPAYLSSLPPNSFLVIVAAGNDNVDLNNYRLHPAWDGGANGVPSLIVVGAAQPDGTRAPFSNYGEGRVDIIAPGCRLSLQTPQGEVNDVGTSFAAPLVTFTAAISHGLGIMEMLDVKKHIIASADYSPAIEKDVAMLGARLNVVRAVESLYDDVVTDKSGKDIVGTWQHPDNIALCSGQAKMQAGDILRIDVVAGEGNQPTLRILRDGLAHGVSPPMYCPAGDGVTLQTTDPATSQTVTTTYTWDSIRAFVPAHFQPLVAAGNGGQGQPAAPSK